jgi:OmpA-OmpF porin, OOP family
MKVGKWVAAVLGIVAAFAAAPAAAQDGKGLYLGGSFGLAQYSDSCTGLTVSCDDEDAGFRIFGGYQFNRWVAVEAGWADMGKVLFEGAGINQETEVYGYDITAVVFWPVLDWMAFFGKGGAYRMRAASELTVGGVPQSAPGKTSSGFTYGLGAEFRVGGLGIRAEFQRYDNVGGVPVGEDSVLFYSAGVLWRF